MTIFLHNPANQAHVEELRDRLAMQLACAPCISKEVSQPHVLIDYLAGVVRAMDTGSLTPKEALEIFARYRVPGFSFGKWLVEMVDEGVYLEELYNEAA